MADDDKDKKLKELEEAVEKAQEALKAAGGVPDAIPAPTAPNLGGSGQLAPLRSNSDTIADRAKSNGLDLPPASTAPVGKSKKTPEEKDASKINKLAKQAAQRRQEAAVAYAQYKRNLARAAQQAKDESEHIRGMREDHEKDMPSLAEGLLAKVSGGMTGVLLGTFKRERAVSEAVEQEITLFKAKMKIQDDIRKGAAMARSTRAGTAASSVLSLSERNAISGAGNVLTSNAFGNKLFEDGKNPLNGIGTNTDKDTPAQVREWYAKTSKKAFAGNKKAQRETATAASRIADRKARLLPVVERDDLRRDNKLTYKEKVYASIPTLLGEPEVMMDSISHIWHDEVAIKKQIDDWETLKAYHQMFDVLAASTDPAYADFAAKWADEKNRAERSDILGNVNAMKDMAEEFKITITAQQRNVDAVKKAGRRVADINAKIKGLEKGTEADKKEADRLRENELPEADENLDLTLVFSGHSDLTVGRNKDGSLKISEKPDGESLIVQSLDASSGKVIYDVNRKYISSLPDELQPAALERAGRALTLATEHSAFTPPAVIEVDPVGGTLTLTLNEYNEWKKNPKNKKQVAAFNRIAKGIAEKVLLNDEISFEDLFNGDATGYLSDEEDKIMRNRYARMMILQFKEEADKIK